MRNARQSLSLVVLTCGAFCSAIAAMPAFAQDGHGTIDFNFHAPPARSQMLMQSLFVEGRQQTLGCEQLGCLMFVNRSKEWDAVSLTFDTVLPVPNEQHDPVWSGNVLHRPLTPQTTFGLVKRGDETTCNLPVRVIMRNRKTHEETSIAGTASLCAHSGLDIFELNVVRPGVHVGDSGDAPATDAAAPAQPAPH